jgi:predicted alpha-1,2-mannosidase
MSASIRTRLAAAAVAAAGVLTMVGAGTASAAPAPVQDPASLVNPIIGTSGAVDTFPGADMPFGMLQWSPDTSPQRPDGGGYEYNASNVRGFSLTHISGPGCPANGDIPILPMVGAMPSSPGSATQPYTHSSETAQAGDYKVTTGSGANAVTSELTTTTRAGMAHFTFPQSDQSRLLLKVAGSATQMDGTTANVVGNDEVTGSVTAGHFCGAGSQRDYTLHFDIHFQHPFTSSSTWTGGPNGGPGGVALTFDTTQDQTVPAKIGISYTSAAGAADNLSKEIPAWDFAAVKTANHQAWNAVLDRISIGGGTHDQQVQFYTALYHALLHPSVFSDDNGQYTGMDGKVHTTAAGHDQYANYSGWDIYRSQVQLAALVAPHQTSDSIRSMLNDYDQSGMLPKWAQANGESYVMVGDPADPIIADAYAFGARDFDASKALAAMATEATQQSNIRPGESTRDQYGYLPYDMGYGCCNFYGPVSTQLEYDSADYAIASLAQSLGQRGTYTKFATRAQDWENVFNPSTGYVQAKEKDGSWVPGFTPSTGTGMVEGTSAQYTPMVPFNLAGVIAARGGSSAWESYLDSLFTNIANPGSTNADLSNEPSVEIPWEYDYVGAPWKTQNVVREAQQQLYFNAPRGQFGNDDLGAMSSWYVFSNLGMYPETPGTDTLVFGSPVFPYAAIHLANGKDITINAPNAAPGSPYVQGLKLNGSAWPKTYLSGNQYQHGATLDFDLGTTPNKSWGSAASAAPPSDATGEQSILASVDPGNLVLQPGTSADTTLKATNVSSAPDAATWAATADKGLTVSPASGTLRLPADGSATQKVTIGAASDTPDGRYSVTFKVTTQSGETKTETVSVAVAKRGEIWPYYTNAGVSNDTDTSAANYDGGGWSYSAQALSAAGATQGGTVTADGISYTWPDVAPGGLDNIESSGQTIPLDAPAGATQIGLLGSATNAGSSGAGGTATVTYTDGSTSTFTARFSDWTLGGGGGTMLAGNSDAVRMPYRNYSGNQRDNVVSHVFALDAPLSAGKTVSSITLPVASGGDMHVFSIGFR